MGRVPTPETGPLERATLARARRGDALAFEALVRRHRDRVYGVALRLLNSTEEAAQVSQATFLAAHRQLAWLHSEAELVAWAQRTATVESLLRLRRRGSKGPTRPDEAMLAWTPGVRGVAERAAAALAVELRAVLVLRDLDGASYQDIAELTDTSVETVKRRLHLARLAVRAALARFYADTQEARGASWRSPPLKFSEEHEPH